MKTAFEIAMQNEVNARHFVRRSIEQQGHTCPKCNGRKLCWEESRNSWQCSSCHHRKSLKSQTLMHSSKIPLYRWLQGIFILCFHSGNISSVNFAKALNLTRQPTAWFMMHKLRTAAGSYLKRKTEQNTIDLSESYACLLGLRKDKFSKSKQRIASVRIAVLGAKQTSCKQYIASEFGSSHQGHLTDRELQSSTHRREFKRIQSIESLIFESDSSIKIENSMLTTSVSRKIMQVHQTVTERYFNKYLDEFNFFVHSSEDSGWHLFYSLIETSWPKKRDLLWKPPL